MTTLIDADETPWITQWKWSARKNNRGIYYACRGERIQGTQKFVHLHRAIYERHHGIIEGGLEIDHINREPLDNRLSNLRAVTRSVNNANRLHARQRKYDLPKGVFPRKRRFIAQISINKKLIYLGSFGTAEEAHATFNAAWNKTYAN